MIPFLFIAGGAYLLLDAYKTPKKLSHGDYLPEKEYQDGDELVLKFKQDSWLELYEQGEEYPSIEIPFQAGETFEVTLFGVDDYQFHAVMDDGSLAFIPKNEVEIVAVNDEVSSFAKGGNITEKKKMGRACTYAKGGKTKYWIQDAIKKKGALRATAKKEGLIKGEEKLSMTDLKKLEKKGGKTAQRARLAETLKKMKDGGKVQEGDIVVYDGCDAEVTNSGEENFTVEFIGKRPEGGDKRMSFGFDDVEIKKSKGKIIITDRYDDSPDDPRDIDNTMGNSYKGKSQYQVRKALEKKGYKYLGHQSAYDDNPKLKVPEAKDWKLMFRNDFGTNLYVSDSLKQFYIYQGGE